METLRTKAVNALTALVRIADLGIDARRPLGTGQVGEIARRRPGEEDPAAATARTKAGPAGQEDPRP
ncbi:hypothetical protein Shyhy01_16810 [Streptomyces hygroscopicus subsp. hygroscopicus]|nr:hypothetical protein Shyhy01_16810 [Streptomyces hygroscopicus subsp. hygroscopicus]